MTGTDATHADHIETIKKRNYVTYLNGRFEPTNLGLGLVEGYDSIGHAMFKPYLRASLEKDLRAICEGKKSKEKVLKKQLEVYKNLFMEACRNGSKLDQALAKYFGSPKKIIPNKLLCIY